MLYNTKLIKLLRLSKIVKKFDYDDDVKSIQFASILH